MAKAPVVLKLKEPIQFGSETITELTVNPPKSRHFRKMPVDMKTATMGDMLDLAVDLCAQPPSVIGDLGMEDMMALSEIIADFLPAAPVTGPAA